MVSDLSLPPDLTGDIRSLLLEKLSIRVDSVETDLLEAGILDSVAQVQLLLHLEKRFGLRMPMEEFEIDSFRSIVKIATLVAERTRPQAGRATAAEEPVLNGDGGGLSDQRHLILEIQALLLDKLAIRVDAEQDLPETGVFDSMALVQIILLLEEHFSIHLPLEDLEIDSFRSVTRIAKQVAGRRLPTSLNGDMRMHAHISS